MSIVFDINILKNKSIKIKDKKEIESIIKELIFILSKNPQGYFLTAPQIGINKKIAIINVYKTIVLINPEIIDRKIEIPYIESNLSFPNKLFETYRWANITIKADNLHKKQILGIKEENANLLNNIKSFAHPKILECVSIQQSIDMLEGVMPHQRNNKILDKNNEYKTNEIVEIIKDKEIKKIKYKKAINFLKNGWAIKEL